MHSDLFAIGLTKPVKPLQLFDALAKIILHERAPEEESGGNSRFAGGVMRFAYESVDDLKRVTDLTDEEVANSDFGTNTREEYLEDIYRLTSYRTDPDLSETLVNESLETMAWLRSKGTRFVPNYGRQSGMVNGKRKFFGRLPIETRPESTDGCGRNTVGGTLPTTLAVAW